MDLIILNSVSHACHVMGKKYELNWLAVKPDLEALIVKIFCALPQRYISGGLACLDHDFAHCLT